MLPHMHSLWEDLPSTVQFRLHRAPLARVAADPKEAAQASPQLPMAWTVQTELDLPVMLLVYEHAFLRQLVRFFGAPPPQARRVRFHQGLRGGHRQRRPQSERG